MSNTIDNAFKTIFDLEVKHAFQRTGPQLRNFVRVRDAADGDSMVFQKIGAGVATQKLRNGDVVPMNVDHSTVTVQTEDWYAAEYADKLDQAKTSINLRDEYSKAAAMALGRKHDDLIIDSWVSSGASSTGVLASLNLANVLGVLEIVRDLSADDSLFFVIGNSQYTDLMSVPQFASADYTPNGPFKKSNRRFSWLDFDWLVLNDLPKTGTTRSCWAGSKNATGFGINSDIAVEINYVAQKTSWLVNTYMSVGAAAIDSDGLVEVQVTE